MNFPFKVAKRYIFSKKSTNAINIISIITMSGIMIGACAMILILSVFNGFEDLITGLFNSFNPDVKVTLVEGKVFPADSNQIGTIRKIDGVETVSISLEEIAFFSYEESQDFGIVKGVDENFAVVSGVDSSIIRGRYLLKKGGRNYAVLGAGMEYKLSVNVEDPMQTLSIYMPKRKQGIAFMQNAFKKKYVYPAGTFAIQQEFDEQYVLTDLAFARDLLSYKNNEISAIEVGLEKDADVKQIKKEIRAIVGDQFEIKNRYEQDEAFFKLMNVEKWITYAVLSFSLLLISFNVVGALWMLVLDKRKDIAILKSMGATDNMVRNIFLYEGILLSLIGAGLGFLFAIIIYILQVTIGIVRLSGSANLLIDSYPISLRFSDFLLTFITVLIIGIFASWLPANRTKRIQPLVRNE